MVDLAMSYVKRRFKNKGGTTAPLITAFTERGINSLKSRYCQTGTAVGGRPVSAGYKIPAGPCLGDVSSFSSH